MLGLRCQQVEGFPSAIAGPLMKPGIQESGRRGPGHGSGASPTVVAEALGVSVRGGILATWAVEA